MVLTVVASVFIRLSSRSSVKCSIGSTGVIEILLPSSESDSELYVTVSLYCQLAYCVLPPVHSRHD